jgi:hypothetical protein
VEKLHGTTANIWNKWEINLSFGKATEILGLLLTITSWKLANSVVFVSHLSKGHLVILWEVNLL